MTQKGHSLVGNNAVLKTVRCQRFRLAHTYGKLCRDFVESVDGLVHVIQIRPAGQAER
jgi:hypothetical protein